VIGDTLILNPARRPNSGSRSSKVIDFGTWYQSKACLQIPINDQYQLWSYLALFQRYCRCSSENSRLPLFQAKIGDVSLEYVASLGGLRTASISLMIRSLTYDSLYFTTNKEIEINNMNAQPIMITSRYLNVTPRRTDNIGVAIQNFALRASRIKNRNERPTSDTNRT